MDRDLQPSNEEDDSVNKQEGDDYSPTDITLHEPSPSGDLSVSLGAQMYFQQQQHQLQFRRLSLQQAEINRQRELLHAQAMTAAATEAVLEAKRSIIMRTYMDQQLLQWQQQEMMMLNTHETLYSRQSQTNNLEFFPPLDATRQAQASDVLFSRTVGSNDQSIPRRLPILQDNASASYSIHPLSDHARRVKPGYEDSHGSGFLPPSNYPKLEPNGCEEVKEQSSSEDRVGVPYLAPATTSSKTTSDSPTSRNPADSYARRGLLGPWSKTSAGLMGSMILDEDEDNPKRSCRQARKPKRPLSAYNLFFREERARIIAAQKNEQERIQSANTPTNSSKSLKGRLPIRLGFENLAKTVGERWKTLNADELVYYQKLAEEDLVRYRSEKRVFESYEDNEEVKTSTREEDADKYNEKPAVSKRRKVFSNSSNG